MSVISTHDRIFKYHSLVRSFAGRTEVRHACDWVTFGPVSRLHCEEGVTSVLIFWWPEAVHICFEHGLCDVFQALTARDNFLTRLSSLVLGSSEVELVRDTIEKGFRFWA